MPITADGNWINTFSGVAFHPLEPRAQDIVLEDIARGLSHMCRYTGQTTVPYSVAEHSVLVAKGVAALGGSRGDQKWAILHDATEAYIADIASPLKKHPSFAFYREVEKKLMDVIAERFELVGPEPDLVRYVDAQMIAFESVDKRIIQTRNPNWPMIEQDERLKSVIDIQCLLPASSYGAFMMHFRELFG